MPDAAVNLATEQAQVRRLAGAVRAHCVAAIAEAGCTARPATAETMDGEAERRQAERRDGRFTGAVAGGRGAAVSRARADRRASR